MAQYTLRFDGATNMFVSEPPGVEVVFDGKIPAWVWDGRVMVFDGAENAFVRDDGQFIRWDGAENMFISDDRSITAYFDAQIPAWVIDDSGDPRYRVVVTITGQGTVTGAGWYVESAPVSIVATAATGWELQTLTRNGSPITTPHNFNMPTSTQTIAAMFRRIDIDMWIDAEIWEDVATWGGL